MTQRELNRALLARQLLLDRAALSIPGALERMGGLQAQYAPAMYQGLWSRVDGLLRDEVTQALHLRAVIQGTLLRSTIHLVSAPDYWPFAIAVREARRAWFRRATKDAPTPDELAASAVLLRAALADGPLRPAEIDRIVGARHRAGIGYWLDLVRVPPSGTWERRRADLYAPAEDWFGPRPANLTEAEGIAVLVRRYLGAFGPATPAAIASWAALPVAKVQPVVAALRPRRFHAEDGAELVDLPDAPLPDPATPAPVRFLPTWDAALLVHARRSGILPEEYRPLIFNTKMPQSVGTFLVDGAVAGTWRYRDGHVTVQEFRELPAAVRREVDDEAERLTAFQA